MTSSVRESIRDLQAEIITRVEAERNLQKSLLEKNVLLKEIHHRVKNNMQLVSSLINLQAHYTDDPGYAALMEESHIRINSMAMVHEMLYQSDNVSMINLGSFTKKLSEYIERYMGGKGGEIKLSVDSGDIFIDINCAIPCALIMNELITNTHKHAFPEGASGEKMISIRIEKNDDSAIRLEYRDNGTGLPEEAGTGETKTLGFQLINGLAAQINATVSLRNDNGFFFSFAFDSTSLSENR
jgi:two-component sensor histidine kinase